MRGENRREGHTVSLGSSEVEDNLFSFCFFINRIFSFKRAFLRAATIPMEYERQARRSKGKR
jgi:hypothetical protein